MTTSVSKIIEHVVDELAVDVKAGVVINAAIALITCLVKKKPKKQNMMEKAANTLIKYYDKYPEVMSCVGLAIGIMYLVDSNGDRLDVRRLQDELMSAFRNYPSNTWPQRLAEIRVQAEALKSRQLKMGVLKFILSIPLGYFAYASTAGILAKTALAVGSGLCGAAAVMNGVNYYNLHELLRLLERDGHLH